MMNIAFAKIGKSIKFAGKGYTPTGGDNEPEGCLLALANNNPDITFYIVGRSNYKTLTDLERSELFPFGNIIDVWSDYNKNNPIENHLIDYFNINKIQIDFSIFLIGQIGIVTIPNKINKLKDESPGFASVIQMTLLYTTPIYNWINETNIPYLEIINDPRYRSNQARDLLRGPTYSLSQYNETYTRKFIRSYEDQTLIEESINSVYSGVETLFCVNRKLPSRELNKEKSDNFVIVLNEGKPSRYKMLEEWILSRIEDVSIYGAWDHEKTKTDSRFLGSRQLDEIQNIMSNVKYTFIIPIKDGWVTSKYIEMIHAGVIPFFHPSYDRQNHLDVPEFIRPDTPEELEKRIKILETNDEFRLEVITLLQNKYCKPEYYSGDFINEVIMKTVYKHFDREYKKSDLETFNKQIISTLDNFF